MGDSYTFIDCPGSVEFVHDMRAALPAVDAAVVVCEADEKKMPQLQLILRELEELNIPRFLFLNKIDKAEAKVMEALQILQPASRKPLVMRQLPIRQNDIVTGFVDLALERVHVYKEHAPSEVVPLEGENLDRSKDARFSMLEKLADHDDELMEQLLADIPPPRDKVFDDLAKELRDGVVVPVLMGVATRTNGVLRLLKALRHEAPNVEATAKRLGVNGQRAARLCAEDAQHRPRRQDVDRPRAVRPDRRRRHAVVAGARGRPGVRHLQACRPDHREARPRRRRRDGGARQARIRQDRRHAVGRQAGACGARRGRAACRRCWRSRCRRRERKDDVKLGQALHKLVDEDPSIHLVHNPETHEVVMWGQGEMHLRVASEKLAGHFGVAINTGRPSVGYNETIKKPVQQRGRHKKQSGGHGQFGDVVLDIKPLPRSAGFKFEDKITGGVVPRNYIPSVEEGVINALKHGPLGFQVVDVAVALVDGSYHTVDSSDMAFQTAARIGIVEGLPQCQPVLLEPIHLVEIVCPTDATAKMNAILSGRRGQILGFDTREGWDGWDVVRAKMPESEIGDLIIEVRSATAGVGSFTFKFDHMAELTGKTADQIIAARRAAE